MRYKINLLPKKEESLSEKIYVFLVNYLRYIIVITQLVVIGVFFYRLQIDQRVIDLKESVTQKKEIIEIVSPLLNEAKYIDKKSKEIEKIIKIQNKLESRLNYLINIFPESAYLKNLIYKDNYLEIEGLSENISYLQAFVNKLRQERFFKNIDLKSIKKTDLGYNFILSLN